MDIVASDNTEHTDNLPEYYKPHRKKSMDYLTIIFDDIRNYRTLNKMQILYISKLSLETKQIIIETYNDCMAMVEDILTENENEEN